MFAYYLRARAASFRRNPGLTALMVFAIALGISVCMITLTSYRAAAAQPGRRPQRASCSRRRSTAGIRSNRYDEDDKTLAPTMLTYRDARALYASDDPGPQGHHVQGRRHLQPRGQGNGAASTSPRA